MSSLYELQGDFLRLAEMMEQPDLTPEMEEAIQIALDDIKDDINNKLDGYAKVIRNFEADIAALKAEEDRIRDRRKKLESNITRMKTAMRDAMLLAIEPDDKGRVKAKTALFSFSVRTNAPQVKFDIPDDQLSKLLSRKYLIPVEPAVDTKLIKDDLQNGDEQTKFALEGLAHLESSQSIIIK